MDCDIEIEMPMPELREVFSGVRIYANDGVRTTIEAKGHGLQRSMIFTILRAYSELSNISDGQETQKNTIFIFEEPELYLHPQSQRTLMKVFRKIASGKDQVVYSTHSSLFMDIRYFDEICIMRREKIRDMHKSYPTQLTMNAMLVDLKVRKNIEGSEEGIREQYSHVFNPIINEGFFADKVIIVEGASEQYSFPIYSDALNYNFDKNNISIVHTDGKGQMDRLLRVFNGFKIPTYLIFDGDKNNEDVAIKEKTLELISLLDVPLENIDAVTTNVTDKYTVFENNLEDVLKEKIKDYNELITEVGTKLGATGKPLRQRYIAKKICERMEENELPEIIKNIIEKIKDVSYTESLLKTEG